MIEQSKPHLDTRVSLFFEGLMIACFTKDNRCQLGLYTSPIHDHIFKVSIYDARNFRNGAIAYKQCTCLDVKRAAPLWLYVDLGNGRQKDIYSATRFALHNESDPRSFEHVLDFDGPELHGPPDEVTINPDALSILNVLQGLFYSAQLDDFQRSVAAHDDHHCHLKENGTGEPIPLLNKATLVGAQIKLPEKDDMKLKLEASSGEALLSVTLQAGVQYIVYVEFVPEPATDPHSHSPRSHFHRFYDAIKPRSRIQYNITGLPKAMEVKSLPTDPCTAVTASKHDSLEIVE